MSWKPSTKPLCMNSQRPLRNGWQFVCCTGEPVEARMCAKTSGEAMCPENSRRLRSFQAGSMLRKTPGVVLLAVPAEPEAVAVRLLGAEP